MYGFKFVHGYIDKIKGDLLDSSDIHTTENCPAINFTCKYTKKTIDRQEHKSFRCPVIDMSRVERDSVSGIDPLFNVVYDI